MSQPSPEETRTVSLLNGDIVSDTVSDDATDFVDLHSLASARACQIVDKRRKALSRRTRRLKAKAVAQRNFLGRKKANESRVWCTNFQTLEKLLSHSYQNQTVVQTHEEEPVYSHLIATLE